MHKSLLTVLLSTLLISATTSLADDSLSSGQFMSLLEKHIERPGSLPDINEIQSPFDIISIGAQMKTASISDIEEYSRLTRPWFEAYAQQRDEDLMVLFANWISMDHWSLEERSFIYTMLSFNFQVYDNPNLVIDAALAHPQTFEAPATPEAWGPTRMNVEVFPINEANSRHLQNVSGINASNVPTLSFARLLKSWSSVVYSTSNLRATNNETDVRQRLSNAINKTLSAFFIEKRVDLKAPSSVLRVFADACLGSLDCPPKVMGELLRLCTKEAETPLDSPGFSLTNPLRESYQVPSAAVKYIYQNWGQFTQSQLVDLLVMIKHKGWTSGSDVPALTGAGDKVDELLKSLDQDIQSEVRSGLKALQRELRREQNNASRLSGPPSTRPTSLLKRLGSMLGINYCRRIFQ